MMIMMMMMMVIIYGDYSDVYDYNDDESSLMFDIEVDIPPLIEFYL